jgi:geranylgeranyl pyrophosphate synthase
VKALFFLTLISIISEMTDKYVQTQKMITRLSECAGVHLDGVKELMQTRLNKNIPEMVAGLDLLIDTDRDCIRPRVVLLIGRMFRADIQKLMSLAAAVEMLHTATVVHDKLTNGALPSYEIADSWSPAATVLAGDFVFASASRLAADTQSTAVMQIFAETLAVVVSGGVTGLFRNGDPLNRQGYLQLIEAKTASKFALASGAAAILGNADQEMVNASRSFGHALGMAYQIAVDMSGSNGQGGFLDGIENVTLIDAANYVQRGLNSLSSFPDFPERQRLAELSKAIVNRSY